MSPINQLLNNDDLYLLINNLPLKQKLQFYCADRKLRQLVQQVRFPMLVIHNDPNLRYGYDLLPFKQNCCCDHKLKQLKKNYFQGKLYSMQVNDESPNCTQMLNVFRRLFARLQIFADLTESFPKRFHNLKQCPLLQHLHFKIIYYKFYKYFYKKLQNSDFVWSKLTCLEAAGISFIKMQKYFPALQFVACDGLLPGKSGKQILVTDHLTNLIHLHFEWQDVGEPEADLLKTLCPQLQILSIKSSLKVLPDLKGLTQLTELRICVSFLNEDEELFKEKFRLVCAHLTQNTRIISGQLRFFCNNIPINVNRPCLDILINDLDENYFENYFDRLMSVISDQDFNSILQDYTFLHVNLRQICLLHKQGCRRSYKNLYNLSIYFNMNLLSAAELLELPICWGAFLQSLSTCRLQYLGLHSAEQQIQHLLDQLLVHNGRFGSVAMFHKSKTNLPISIAAFSKMKNLTALFLHGVLFDPEELRILLVKCPNLHIYLTKKTNPVLPILKENSKQWPVHIRNRIRVPQ